jgi:hypothetical protein
MAEMVLCGLQDQVRRSLAAMFYYLGSLSYHQGKDCQVESLATLRLSIYAEAQANYLVKLCEETKPQPVPSYSSHPKHICN